MTPTTPADPGILTALLAFVASEFNKGQAVDPDQRLMPDLVDSLGVFVLVEHIEHEYRVTLEDIDLSAENLETTSALAMLLTERLRFVRCLSG